MFYWRITKYDPIYRNDSGAYTRHDWTAISDIGNNFDGTILTPDDYYKVEDAYVYAIQKVAIENHVNYFQIKKL